MNNAFNMLNIANRLNAPYQRLNQYFDNFVNSPMLAAPHLSRIEECQGFWQTVQAFCDDDLTIDPDVLEAIQNLSETKILEKQKFLIICNNPK